MKTVILVLLQSFILTVFFTAIAQTYIPEVNLPLHVSSDSAIGKSVK